MTSAVQGALPTLPGRRGRTHLGNYLGARARRVLGWLRGDPAGTEVADLLVIGGRRSAAAAAATGKAAAPGPAVADLYRDRRLHLVRLALLLVDDLPTAEDVVQDAFAAVYQKHGPVLRGVENVSAYLSTSVVNASRSVLRRRRSARGLIPQRVVGPTVDERMLLAEEHRAVLDALRTLAPRQREVLVLRYWSDLSEAQIADMLGLSRGTVKSTASRALDTLEKRLEETR
jgi:RNA polymerase sigma-70 factor (sigma-E family)